MPKIAQFNGKGKKTSATNLRNTPIKKIIIPGW
jgi:hypothetical protein